MLRWIQSPQTQTERSVEPQQAFKKNIKVFISYASDNSDKARRLYNDLTEAGIDPWLDRESILPGRKRKP